jgi:oligosaccharide repeat unit polymerase
MLTRQAPDGSIDHTRTRLMLIIHVLVSGVIGLVWMACSVIDASEAWIWPLSILCLALVIWLFYSWRSVGRSAFDPYGLFLLAAVLFNASQVCLEAFGLNPHGILDGDFPAALIVQCVLMVMAGLAGLHLGALSMLTIAGHSQTNTGIRLDGPSPWSCRTVGIAMLLVSVIPALLVARARLATVYESGYYALYQEDQAAGMPAGLNILGAFLGPGALFLLAGSRRSAVGRNVSLVPVALSTLLQLFSGDRGHATMLAVSYAWLWHRSVRPLPKTVLLTTGAIMLFVIFPVIREVRDFSGADRLTFQFVRSAYLSMDNPVLAILSEMGGSLITLAHTLQLVPSTRPFDLGLGYLYAVTPVIPSFFWDVHPVVAHGRPSDWLIWSVAPSTARVGGGLGFSFIAEAYLNFGPLGIPIVSAAVGFLYCKFLLWADHLNNPARMASIASFTSFVLLYARGEASFIIRPLVWYALVPYLACCMVDAIARWKSRDRVPARYQPIDALAAFSIERRSR